MDSEDKSGRGVTENICSAKERRSKFDMAKVLGQIKAVLFDVDGTLVNSGKAHIYSIRGTFSEMKIPEELTDQEILEVIGSPIDKIFDRLVGIKGGKEHFIQIFRRKMYEEGGLDYLEPYPMVRETLLELKNQGIQLGIVTNKRRHTTELFLKKVGIEKGIFEFLITGEDSKNYKPAPDLVLKAVEKLGLLPSEVALVGDTDSDIMAAKGAGVISIGANYGFGKNLQDADLLIHLPEDLLTLLA